MKKLILAAACVGMLTCATFAGTTTWTSTSIPFWNSSTAWNNGVPNWTATALLQNDLSTVFSIDIQSSTTALDPVQGIVFNSGAGSSGFTLRTSSGSPGGFSMSTGGIINNDSHAQTFNVPATLVSGSGLGGSGANQTWTAASGDVLFSGVYGVGSTVATVNNNGATLTIDGAHNTTIGTTGRGDIIGAGGLIKNGAGALTLGGLNNNTFSGGLTLNAGTIVAGKSAALGTGRITLNGGTVQANFYNLTGNGALSLQGNATIDFGGPGPFIQTGGTNVLSFADSHSIAWAAGMTLTITDWVAGDALRFGTSSTGLTAGQLSQITFAGIPDSFAGIDPNGFVVPIPEPSTAALSLLGGFSLAVGLIIRRRRS